MRGLHFAKLTALLLMPSSLAATAVCAQQAVAIDNPGFEQADPTGKMPASWAYIEAKDGDGHLTIGEGRAGGRAARVTCTRRDEGWGPGLGQVGVVSVKGDQWYTVSFWARADGVNRGAFVALRDSTDWRANRIWRPFFPGPMWREFHYAFYSRDPLPAEVSRLQFSFDSTGTLWIDDVSIVESDPQKTVDVLDVAGRKNLLPNSSFELGSFGWATYGADELFGEVDAGEAAHGKQSFRITLADGKLPVYYNDFTYRLLSRASHETIRKLPICPIGYSPVQRDEPVTFSFQLKASRPDLPVVASIIEGSGKTTTRNFAPSTQWQRFSLQTTPESDIVFVTLGIDATEDLALPATLWLDALQLELGAEATEYEPAFPLEAALETGREGNIYLRGQSVVPRLTALNHSGEAQAATVSVEVEDFFGDRRIAFEARLAVDAGGEETREVDLGITEPGFYRANFTVAGEGWETYRSLRLAVIHPFEQEYPQADGFLGINHAFVSDLYMRRARAMGLTWVRSWFCKWEDIEREQGSFDFSEARLQYDRLKRLGMHVQLCLSDPSSQWASTAPEVLPGTTGGESQSRRVWWLPGSFADYETYVQTVAREFEGEVSHYEVFNEPSDRKGGDDSNFDLANTYPRFLKRAGRAIRSASSDSQLLGAGLNYFDKDKELSPIIENLDIISEHRYPRLAPTANMLESFAGVHERARQAGGDRPIWMTEYGVYADDDPDPTTAGSSFLERYGKHSERLVATFVAKHHVIALASGVEKVFFHIGNWAFMVNREHGCGFHAFFEWGGVPRKTYSTLNTLAWVLPPGSQFVRTWTGPRLFYAFEFERQGTRTVAIWAEAGLQPAAEAAEALNASNAVFTNVCGARIQGLPEMIEDSPIYITARGPAQQAALTAFLKAVSGE